MQNPVRYYITQNDDQPVVRSIPVAVREESSVPEAIAQRAHPRTTDLPVATRRPRMLKRRIRTRSSD